MAKSKARKMGNARVGSGLSRFTKDSRFFDAHWEDHCGEKPAPAKQREYAMTFGHAAERALKPHRQTRAQIRAQRSAGVAAKAKKGAKK